MARLFTEGFESGSLPSNLVISTGSVATSSTRRSGAYSVSYSGATWYIEFPSSSEFYIRAALYTTVFSTNDRILWRSAGTALGRIRLNANRVEAYVGSTLVGTGTTILSTGVWYLIEIHIKVADSGGVLTVKLDGLEEISFSGDTKPDANTTIDTIAFSAPGASTNLADDIAINDTTSSNDNSWCGDGHIIALKPNGAGDVTQLTPSTGSNYTCVDEIPSNSDTDYVEGSTVDEYDLYAIEDSTLTNYIVTRVWVESRSRDTVADGGNIALGIKPSGSTAVWSSDLPLLTSYRGMKGTEYLVNPADSQAFEDADLDGLQIGVKTR